MKTAGIVAFLLVLAFYSSPGAGESQAINLLPLAVTVSGQGNVQSNPSGIDCDSGNTGTCSAYFAEGTSVALLATPPPNDESGSYGFSEWSGDASGNIAATAVVMNASKNVTAQFFALGIPPIAPWEIPAGLDTVYYHPVLEPVYLVGNLDEARPLAIGDTPGVINLFVGMNGFIEPVDIYIALTIDGWNDALLFGPGNSLHIASAGLVAWKQNWTAPINESLLGDIAGLPGGTYRVFVQVAESADPDNAFTWQTYFEVTPFLLVDPFSVP